MPPLLSKIPARGVLPPSPHDPTQIPVVFLHGILGSPGNFEKPAWTLVGQGRPFYAPAYGDHGTAALDDSLHELLTFLDGIRAPQVDIVGHSAGGLLGLRLAQVRPGKVRGLIGLGAAFNGVPHRVPLRFLAQHFTGKALMDITRPLPAKTPHGVKVISVISDADYIVPAASSSLGSIVHISGVRHENLPREAGVILDQLRALESGGTES